jgi:hypothetical protein
MRDEQQDHAANQTQSLPAQFAVLDAVLVDQGVGIEKDQGGVVKRDAVLAFIAGSFGSVPFEEDHASSV